MKTALLAFMSVIVLLAFGSTAEAARSLPATLAISPTSPSADSTATLSGCGFVANTNVRFVQQSEAGTAWFGNLAGADGCITIETWNGAAGDVTVDAEQVACNNGGRCTYELMATLTYQVQVEQ